MKPTGATKEWRVEPRPIHGYQVIDSDGTEILADVYRKEDAELIVTAVNERERLREALTQIAAFNDTGANEILQRTGSYSGFDEPGAVQTAREALNEVVG